MPALPSTKRAGERLAERLRRVVNVRQEEVAALSWAFLYFFSLLCSYYIVCPMRDAMGIAAGVDNLR